MFVNDDDDEEEEDEVDEEEEEDSDDGEGEKVDSFVPFWENADVVAKVVEEDEEEEAEGTDDVVDMEARLGAEGTVTTITMIENVGG